MIDRNNKDALARQLTDERVSFSEIAGLPDVDASPPLERYIARICARIEEDGISSLYWVTGIHTREIGAALLSALGQADSSNASCCIVANPGEDQAVESFRSRLDIPVMRMRELYTNDSFVVVNEAAVLDVTPVESDGGEPEYTDDPTVVNLYIGLFNMLKSQSEA